MTKEIVHQDWAKFCEKLSTLRRGTFLTIQQVAPDGRRVTIVQDAPLQSAEFTADNACNNVIRFRLGQPGEKPVDHIVIEPIHFKFRSLSDGTYNPLMIEAESGTTFVIFSPSLRQDIMADLHIE